MQTSYHTWAEKVAMILVCILLLSLAPTAAPQNVGGVATSSTSLRLYWSPPPYQHQTPYYRVSIRNAITDAVARYTTSNTQLTVSSLDPYSTYRCTVAAVTVAQGPQSAPITIQTYQDGTYCNTKFAIYAVATFYFSPLQCPVVHH